MTALPWAVIITALTLVAAPVAACTIPFPPATMEAEMTSNPATIGVAKLLARLAGELVTEMEIDYQAVAAAAGAALAQVAQAGGMLSQHPEPAADAPVYFELPGAPVTERRVTNGLRVWEKHPDGSWHLINGHHVPDQVGGHPAEAGPEVLSWPGLLAKYGRVQLVPLTEQEQADAVVYGPPGARWGNPHIRCPYQERAVDGHGAPFDVRCTWGVGHIGAHIDATGTEMGMTELVDRRAEEYGPGFAGGRLDGVGITPHEAAEVPCTCGHPAQHQEGCARYARVAGRG